MGLHERYSIIGGNKRYLENQFGFCTGNVKKRWSDMYNDDLARTAEQVKELCSMRESCTNTFVFSLLLFFLL